MKKQIIYCAFIPRLFAVMLDLILISLIVPPISRMFIEYIILGPFLNFFISAQKMTLDSSANLAQMIIDPNMYVNTNRIILLIVITMSINLLLISSYFILSWCKFSATPGKIIMRMKIVNADDFSKPSPFSFVKRFMSYSLALIGMWSIITNKRKMALHDKIAGTVVIQN